LIAPHRKALKVAELVNVGRQVAQLIVIQIQCSELGQSHDFERKGVKLIVIQRKPLKVLQAIKLGRQRMQLIACEH